MDEAIEAMILAYENATIQTVVHSVAWFQHGTVTGQGGVHTYETEFRTEVARWRRIKARHLAGILLALDEGDDIVA